jgi:hypothetical protein
MSSTNSKKTGLTWQDRIKARNDSGLSVSQFCQQKGCSVSSFYQWRRNFGSRIPKAVTELAAPAAVGVSAFQQLIPKLPSGPASSIDFLLPGGTIANRLTQWVSCWHDVAENGNST